MKTIYIYIRQCLAFLCLFTLCGFLLSSCQDDDIQPPDGDARTLTFSVRVPGSSGPSTYALGTTDENEVRTIEVILVVIMSISPSTAIQSLPIL